MTVSRVTVGRITIAWAILLWCSAVVLPNLDSQTRVHPVVKAIVAVVYPLLLIGTPITLVRYFIRAWRRATAVPNRTEYLIWISLESVAGAGLLGILLYATVSFAAATFR